MEGLRPTLGRTVPDTLCREFLTTRFLMDLWKPIAPYTQFCLFPMTNQTLVAFKTWD